MTDPTPHDLHELACDLCLAADRLKGNFPAVLNSRVFEAALVLELQAIRGYRAAGRQPGDFETSLSYQTAAFCATKAGMTEEARRIVTEGLAFACEPFIRMRLEEARELAEEIETALSLEPLAEACRAEGRRERGGDE